MMTEIKKRRFCCTCSPHCSISLKTLCVCASHFRESWKTKKICRYQLEDRLRLTNNAYMHSMFANCLLPQKERNLQQSNSKQVWELALVPAEPTHSSHRANCTDLTIDRTASWSRLGFTASFWVCFTQKDHEIGPKKQPAFRSTIHFKDQNTVQIHQTRTRKCTGAEW